MELINCPNCGKSVWKGTTCCPKCSFNVIKNINEIKKQKKEIEKNSLICKICGNKLIKTIEEENEWKENYYGKPISDNYYNVTKYYCQNCGFEKKERTLIESFKL